MQEPQERRPGLVERTTARGGASTGPALLVDAADHLYAAAALLEELARRELGQDAVDVTADPFAG